MPEEPAGTSSRAAKARTLLEGRDSGVLATVSVRMPGYPFASITPFALDSQGRPLLLLSALAVHTKNLAANAKASLFVFEADAEREPLSSARMNLLGEVERVPEADLAASRERYLARHSEAAQWFDFGDFALYRMNITEVYFIGGFGEMGWVSKNDFQNN